MRYDVLTFDCYGTLVDWRNGIAAAFRRAADPASTLPDDERLLDLHAVHEAAVEAGPYRPYREVLAETARRVAAALGLEQAYGSFDFLAGSLPRWPIFADTVPALDRLRRGGARLGILSNVDDDLLAATVARLEVDFDLLITAQQVGSYKPGLGHFLEARRRIGDRSWLHVAQSRFHDLAPAAALGVPAAWIDRLGETAADGVEPVRTFADLSGLAAWLA